MNVRQQQGAGLIIAMALSMVLIAVAVFLLGKIIPFSRTVSGMEDSLQARYESSSGAEKALLAFYFQQNSRPIGGVRLLNNPYGNVAYNSNLTVDKPDPEAAPFFIKSLTRKTPLAYDGISYGNVPSTSSNGQEFNKLLPGGTIFFNVTGAEPKHELAQMSLTIRTPGAATTTDPSTDPMFLVTLSGIETTFQQNRILTLLPHTDYEGGKSQWNINLTRNYEGITNEGVRMTPADFFGSHVFCDNFCSVEISLVGDIGDLPFLEYQVDHETLVPDINALLISRGEIGGYAHTLYGRVPQQGFLSGISFAAQ